MNPFEVYGNYICSGAFIVDSATVEDTRPRRPALPPPRRRRPSFSRILRTAKREGFDVVVDPSGVMTLKPTSADDIKLENEWDEVINGKD
jgi:hypothetical protein